MAKVKAETLSDSVPDVMIVAINLWDDDRSPFLEPYIAASSSNSFFA